MALKNAKDDADTAFSRDALKGLSYENTFSGATSFLRRRYTKDVTGADLVVTGIPFDQAVTNRPGTGNTDRFALQRVLHDEIGHTAEITPRRPAIHGPVNTGESTHDER